MQYAQNHPRNIGQKLDYPHYWNTTCYQFGLMKSLRPAPDRLGATVGDAFRGLVDNDAYFFESPELKSFVVSPSSAFKLEWRSRRATMMQGRIGSTRIILCSVDPSIMKSGECRRKAWRIWSVVFSNLGVANRFKVRLSPPTLDLSERNRTFLTDPDGVGEKVGYPRGEFGGRKPRPILVGRIWEEQGVTEPNPNIASPPDSAYDGFAWYFCRATIPASLRGKPLYFYAAGVRDIRTFNRLANRTDLWINGAKQPAPVGVYNAKEGGRAGRLWRVDSKTIRYGAENFIAFRVYNDQAAGGIHRRPVRLETEGQNPGMPLPYEFIRSKYTPYFFWAWYNLWSQFLRAAAPAGATFRLSPVPCLVGTRFSCAWSSSFLPHESDCCRQCTHANGGGREPRDEMSGDDSCGGPAYFKQARICELRSLPFRLASGSGRRRNIPNAVRQECCGSVHIMPSPKVQSIRSISAAIRPTNPRACMLSGVRKGRCGRGML